MWWRDGTRILIFAVRNRSKIMGISFFFLFFLLTAKLFFLKIKICQRIPEFLYLCLPDPNFRFREVGQSFLNE